MKKNLMIIALSLSMILLNVNVANAASNKDNYRAGDVVTSSNKLDKKGNIYQKLSDYAGKDTVIIENSPDSSNTSINLYELENGKLVKTGDKISQFSNHYMLFWKADPVRINGKESWKIGDNLFVKSSRVSQINTQKMQAINQKVQSYGNYSVGNTTNNNEMDTIKVNNDSYGYVPVMSLQKDGSFVLINDRVLSNGSNWKIDKIRRYKGAVYCQIATNEWVNATDYVVK
ncbi:hypothetical protein [Companilactobacillus muriivasis]|uniref:hypothetical protein n=1 Tax=Companilactobacillus muriivasis TaxID=3081444 RepID=UPI0030C68E68